MRGFNRYKAQFKQGLSTHMRLLTHVVNVVELGGSTFDKLKENNLCSTLFLLWPFFAFFWKPVWLFRRLKVYFFKFRSILGEQQPFLPTSVFVVQTSENVKHRFFSSACLIFASCFCKLKNSSVRLLTE